MAEGNRRLELTQQQRRELRQLVRSHQREEADRARGILLSDAGWQSAEIARALMVRPESVRHWRTRFRRRGIPGLREQPRPGRPNAIGQEALAIAQELLDQPRTSVGPPWTLPRLIAEIKRRTGKTLSPGYLSRLLRKKGGVTWRRPRHTLNARQDRHAVDEARACLRGLKAKAEAGSIHLLFADEVEVSSHPYLSRLWAKRGKDLRVEAPGCMVRRALFGARVHGTSRLWVQTSPTKDSDAFCRFLGTLKAPFRDKPVHLVLDNGPIHKSRKTRALLEKLHSWLHVNWLPAYAPELNDIERDWRVLKSHYLAQQTFTGIDSLDLHVRAGVAAMNKQRAVACVQN